MVSEFTEYLRKNIGLFEEHIQFALSFYLCNILNQVRMVSKFTEHLRKNRI